MHARLLALGVAILLSAGPIIAKPSLSFFRAVDTTLAHRHVSSAATGDFNHDGTPDIVVSTPGDGTIRVALGRTDGRFGAPANYSVSAGTGDVAVGDFNGDTHIDLVVAAMGIGTLLGRGDGTFQSPIFSAGSATDVVVADFDGDSRLDIASVGRNSTAIVPKTIDVYPGNGDGTFSGFRTVFTTDNSPRAIAAGDFNGDGRPDLVIPQSGNRLLSVYLNQGAMTFARAGSNFTEVGPASTRAGDVDGNGIVDVVTANFLGTITVFFGNGDGTLQVGQTYPASAPCSGSTCPANRSLALADLNNDAALDVIAATEVPGTAAILLNNGAGQFGGPESLEVLSYATHVSAVDVDASGSLDLAVVNSAAAFADDGPRIVSMFRNKLKGRSSILKH